MVEVDVAGGVALGADPVVEEAKLAVRLLAVGYLKRRPGESRASAVGDVDLASRVAGRVGGVQVARGGGLALSAADVRCLAEDAVRN